MHTMRGKTVTKEQFITEVIRGLQANEKVERVNFIPTSNILVELKNGEMFKLIVSGKVSR